MATDVADHAVIGGTTQEEREREKKEEEGKQGTVSSRKDSKVSFEITRKGLYFIRQAHHGSALTQGYTDPPYSGLLLKSP